MNPMKIGKRLVCARGAKTREEVAAALGISPSAVQMYENGARIPRDEIKIKIARLYGRTVGELFFDEYVHVS